MEDILVQVEVRGRVQGVGYRVWLRQVAAMLDLDGWVRNRHDGWVEAVLAGPAGAVEAALALMQRGPDGSRIDDVATRPADVGELSTRPEGAGFTILPDH